MVASCPTTCELWQFMASSLCLELGLLQGMLVTGKRLYVLSLASSSLLQGENLDVPKLSVFSIAGGNTGRHHREEELCSI